jgi:hypothetical protein
MTITKTELDHSLELFYLRNRLAQLEKQIEAEKNPTLVDAPRTFNVVLKVTTLPSSWQDEHVDSGEIEDLFKSNLEDIRATVRLYDEGDSLEVESVTEVDLPK